MNKLTGRDNSLGFHEEAQRIRPQMPNYSSLTIRVVQWIDHLSNPETAGADRGLAQLAARMPEDKKKEFASLVNVVSESQKVSAQVINAKCLEFIRTLGEADEKRKMEIDRSLTSFLLTDRLVITEGNVREIEGFAKGSGCTDLQKRCAKFRLDTQLAVATTIHQLSDLVDHIHMFDDLVASLETENRDNRPLKNVILNRNDLDQVIALADRFPRIIALRNALLTEFLVQEVSRQSGMACADILVSHPEEFGAAVAVLDTVKRQSDAHNLSIKPQVYRYIFEVFYTTEHWAPVEAAALIRDLGVLMDGGVRAYMENALQQADLQILVGLCRGVAPPAPAPAGGYVHELPENVQMELRAALARQDDNNNN